MKNYVIPMELGIYKKPSKTLHLFRLALYYKKTTAIILGCFTAIIVTGFLFASTYSTTIFHNKGSVEQIVNTPVYEHTQNQNYFDGTTK